MIFDSESTYDKQYCVIHKIHIIYFKANKLMGATQCWDCIRLANQKKYKQEILQENDNVEPSKS
jgi:hypothetical protein